MQQSRLVASCSTESRQMLHAAPLSVWLLLERASRGKAGGEDEEEAAAAVEEDDAAAVDADAAVAAAAATASGDATLILSSDEGEREGCAGASARGGLFSCMGERPAVRGAGGAGERRLECEGERLAWAAVAEADRVGGEAERDAESTAAAELPA